jgi:GGDEF domain-containing protein
MVGSTDRASTPLASRAKSAPLTDPFAAAHVRVCKMLGGPDLRSELVRHWLSRSAGSARSEMRYRWELSHRRGTPPPAWAPVATAWTAWRPSEQSLADKDPFAFADRLTLPIVIAENSELLLELAAAGSDDAALLFQEAAPSLRQDLAVWIQAIDIWQSTFALWCLARRRRALQAFHPLAVAIATVHAAACEGKPVHGLRYPFHDVPLVSASAQLAVGLLMLGLDPSLVSVLCESVKSSQREDGGFGDGSGPSDVLTTLVASDLLLRLDPSFDFQSALARLEGFRTADGSWCGYGPEAVWLSGEVLELVALGKRPFAERFRWPYVPNENRDRKTNLPFYSYFADIVRLFSAIPGLANEKVELAFIDLVGFRAFNNAFGQDRGDDVLAELAKALLELTGVGAIRDGGDEFLLVAPPGASGLYDVIETFRHAWVDRFHARFGDETPPVLPRIVVTSTPGRELSKAREDLGRRITALKETPPDQAGILVRV